MTSSTATNKPMIKNIIFDVGKVLVEWQPMEAFRALGFDGQTAAAVAAATVESAEWDESDRGALPDEEILASFIRKAPEYEQEIRLFWQHLDLSIWQYDYARKWIAELKEQGYGVYILSNYGRQTFACTREKALSFLEQVDGAVFSYEVNYIKPEPEIYQILLERYQLTPQECVFLDDRRENIAGADRAGIHTILFEDYAKARDELNRLRGGKF